MPAAINTNLNSLAAQRQLAASANALGTAMQRLSSGLRINGAKDDAAGLAISERFTTQIKGADQAARNINDGISLAQTADAALGSIGNNLQRMRELAVQAANSTNSASDRAALQNEVSQLITETDRIAAQTEFNGSKLLDGSAMFQQFQVGANRQQTVAMNAMGSMRSDTLGTYNGYSGFVGFGVNVGAPSALTLTLNGPGTTYNLGIVATDAKAIAQAINDAGIAGLTSSTFNSHPILGSAQTSTGTTNGVAVFTLNGVNINLNFVDGGGTADVLNRQEAISAINAQSAATGVIATDTGSKVQLSSIDGRNFTMAYSAGTATGSTASDFTLFTGTSSSQILVDYRAPTGTAVTSLQFSGAGLWGVLTPIDTVPSGSSLNKVDVSTAAGAQSAIFVLDVALTTVNAARASMGALQNRFASTISNLQSSSENMSAARGRIVDADFAQETATLSRAQILQQASTAMVAQANQSPQGVLALLR